MKFGEPYQIWMILVLPLAFYSFLRTILGKQMELTKKFASSHLIPILTARVSERRRAIKRWFLILATALIGMTFARPQWGFHWEEAKRKGIDILFAVDTSKSMLAQDIAPDRLSRAKLAVIDLLGKLEGDRVGLIAFAGTSFLQCPLTLDYDAFRQSLDALDTHLIPSGGTNIEAPIREAEKAFSLGEQNHKILVLITDGEDLEANGISAARTAANNGMKIFTVGVGTTSGELIPIQTESGGTEFLKDENGQVIKSRLDENTLKQIAEVSGAFYEPMGKAGIGLEMIYEKGLAPIPKEDLTSKMNKVYNEQYQWPLTGAVLFLIFEILLGDRKKEGVRIWKMKWFASKTAVLFLFIFPFCGNVGAVSTSRAEKEFKNQDFDQSHAHFKELTEKNPDRPELQYNLGSSAYKCDKFEEAASAFQKALKTDQPELQQQTYYNLGNTQYRIGQKTEKENPQQTIQVWQQALQSYQNSMQLKKDDADAKFNYEFVKKKLEKLQKENPPPKQDDQKDQSQNQNQDQKPQPQNQPEKDQDKNKNPNPTPSPDQSKPDPKENPDQKNESSSQENSPQPPDSPKDPDPKQSPPQQKGGGGDQNNSQEKPHPYQAGEMSPEEAKNLLDSLKEDEKKMPLSAIGMENSKQMENNPKRDW